MPSFSSFSSFLGVHASSAVECSRQKLPVVFPSKKLEPINLKLRSRDTKRTFINRSDASLLQLWTAGPPIRPILWGNLHGPTMCWSQRAWGQCQTSPAFPVRTAGCKHGAKTKSHVQVSVRQSLERNEIRHACLLTLAENPFQFLRASPSSATCQFKQS